MSENRDEMLADFQSITAIDDIGEAFSYLEESNWDLLAAIRRFMPQEIAPTESVPVNFPPNSTKFFNQDYSGFAEGASTSSANEVLNLKSDSDSDSKSNKAKFLTFNIHFNNRIYTIKIWSLETVGDLKEKIFNLLHVPMCRQAIRGWPPAKKREAQNSHTRLHSLNLPNESELILTDLTEEGFMDDDGNDEIITRFGQTFTLNVVQQPEGKTMSLQFPGTQKILKVKTDVYSITDIPVRHQEWSGWPVGSDNSTTLAESAIELTHNLVLRSTADKAKNNVKPDTNTATVINLDTDSSADEFEDASDFNADDDFFNDSPAQPRLKHLISDQIEEETIGSIQFAENYIQRYGDPHPEFYQGTLDDAFRDACLKPAKERKLLAIYLHHDQSVLANVFCDQLLKCESIIETLLQNFILFGWDLTFESNKNLILSAIASSVGVQASITVRNIPVDRLPSIVIVAKYRSNCEVLSVIYGNVGVDDLLSRLMETVELYSDRINIEIREENERAARAQVKYEQDIAYQQTLEADRAKEAAKKQKEMEVAAEKKRLESEKAEQDAINEAIRQEAERSLPDEPDDTEIEGVTKIRVRKPTGGFLERKFYVSNRLHDLLNFVASKGFPAEQYKVLAKWPPLDLTTFDPYETLEVLKLYPQEVITLEER